MNIGGELQVGWLCIRRNTQRGKELRLGARNVCLWAPFTDVLRKSWLHLPVEFVEGVVGWSGGRVDRLSPEQQRQLLEKAIVDTDLRQHSENW